MRVSGIYKQFSSEHGRIRLYVAIIVLLCLVFFSSIISTSRILDNIHYIANMGFNSYSRLENMREYGGLPLWSPHFYGGHPLLAIPEEPMFDALTIFMLLFRNIYLALNLATILYFIAAGLGMFVLAYYLKKNPDSAFVAAIIYLFNGFALEFVIPGHINILEGYAILPFIIFFGARSLKEESYVRDAITCGLLLGLQILGGSIIMFLYTSAILFGLIAWHVIGRDFGKRASRAAIVAVLAIAVALGIGAIKLLPTLSYVGISSRSAGVSINEFVGTEDWFSEKDMVPGIGHPFLKIGIIGFVLAIMSVFSIKNRFVIYSLLISALAFLLISSSHVQSFFYSYVPGFGKMRNIERSIVFFAFGASVLAAFGFENLKKFSARFGRLEKYRNIMLAGIAVLILIELILPQFTVRGGFPKSTDFPMQVSNLEVMDYLGKEVQLRSLFRVYNLAQKTIIGASGYHYYVQSDIQDAKGGGGIWINEYVEYLTIAERYNPQKLLGLLNIKYFLIDNAVNAANDSGITYVTKFRECEICTSWEADGPYLYRNEIAMPRAWITQNNIVLLGSGKSNAQLAYTMLISPAFNPWHTTLVMVNSQMEFDRVSQKDLQLADSVIVTNADIAKSNVQALKNYVDSQGNLLPDVFSGQGSVSPENITSAILRENNHTPEAAVISVYEPHKIVVKLDGQIGLLILAEKFFMFPEDWKARINGEEKAIFQADMMNSAVFLHGETGELVFEYVPQTYLKGRSISAATVLLSVIFLAVHLSTRKKPRSGIMRIFS